MVTRQSRDRQSHRVAQQTALAAQPSGLASQAIQFGEAMLGRSIQSIDPGDQPSSSRAYSPWSLGQAPLPAWLPDAARDVLSRLALRVDDRKRVKLTLSIDVHGKFEPGGVTPGLQTRVLEARQSLARLVDPKEVARRGGGFTLPESHDTVIQARKTLAALEAELADVVSRLKPDDEAALLIRTQTWLASSKPREVADPVTLSRTDTVESLRAEHADLLVKLDEVENAPVHSEEVKRRVRTESWLEEVSRRLVIAASSGSCVTRFNTSRSWVR